MAALGVGDKTATSIGHRDWIRITERPRAVYASVRSSRRRKQKRFGDSVSLMVERKEAEEKMVGGEGNMGRAPRVVDEVTATGRGRSDRGGERQSERSRKRQAPTGRSSCRDRLRTGARDDGANPLKDRAGLEGFRGFSESGMPVTLSQWVSACEFSGEEASLEPGSL